jgi:hypothetical protein
MLRDPCAVRLEQDFEVAKTMLRRSNDTNLRLWANSKSDILRAPTSNDGVRHGIPVNDHYPRGIHVVPK